MNNTTPIFYVYIITNLICNKQYVGSHISYSTNIGSDNYWGSSKYLNEDYKIYGKENFVKKILCYDYKNIKDMLNGETEAILNYNTLSPNGYNRYLPNRKCGFYTGGHPLSPEHRKKLSNKQRGKKHTSETKLKISNANKGKTLTENQKEKLRKSKTTIHKQKLSIAITGIKRSSETRKKISAAKLNKPLSDEHKKQLSISAKKRTYKIRGKYIKHLKNEICPYCNKSVSKNMYVRWHGKNCKHRC